MSSSSKAQERETIVTLTETTAEERALTQLKLIFDSIDANEDGTVSKDELKAALDKDESLGTLIKEAGFKLAYSDLSGLDTNKDGSVSWEEFEGNLKEKAVEEVAQTGGLAAAELPAHEKVTKQLRAIFDSIDANQDGSVSKDELRAKLTSDKDEHGLMKDGSFGELVKEAGFNPGFGTFDKLDTNNDGRITWDEFEKHLRETAEVEVKETGEVAAATVEEVDKDGGAAPKCGCC